VFRIVTDQVGSVRLVVNSATGAIAQRLDYDSFGNVALDTNPGFQPFGFGGGLYDADTGLVRLGARDYDATTGRWTAKDASSFVSGDGNLYRYVRNDPVNLMDADGAMPTQPPSPIDKQLAKLAHWLDDPTDIDIPTDLSPEQTAEVVAKRTARMDLEDKILSKIQKLLRIKENAKISPERIGGSGCGIKGLKAFEFMQFWEPIKMGLEYLKTGEVPTWQDLLEEQVYGHRLPEEERQRQRLEALSA
jgi:RHS repeat-associated protein